MNSISYQRFVIVGVTGCGKSTLAERLAKDLALDFIELDALFWKPGWVESDPEEFQKKVADAIRAPRWALAGNYSLVREIVWQRADALIWLDYPFFLVLGRLLRRIWIRSRSRELLWGTNYEPLWIHLKLWSKDSLINWLFQTYWRRKRVYAGLLASPEYSHLAIFHFRSPDQTESWLNTL